MKNEINQQQTLRIYKRANFDRNDYYNNLHKMIGKSPEMNQT